MAACDAYLLQKRRKVLVFFAFGAFLLVPVMAVPFLINAQRKGKDDMKT